MTVTGTLDEQMRAIELILMKLAEDHHYAQSYGAPFPYAGMIFVDYFSQAIIHILASALNFLFRLLLHFLFELLVCILAK